MAATGSRGHDGIRGGSGETVSQSSGICRRWGSGRQSSPAAREAHDAALRPAACASRRAALRRRANGGAASVWTASPSSKCAMPWSRDVGRPARAAGQHQQRRQQSLAKLRWHLRGQGRRRLRPAGRFPVQPGAHDVREGRQRISPPPFALRSPAVDRPRAAAAGSRAEVLLPRQLVPFRKPGRPPAKSEHGRLLASARAADPFGMQGAGGLHRGGSDITATPTPKLPWLPASGGATSEGGNWALLAGRRVPAAADGTSSCVRRRPTRRLERLAAVSRPGIKVDILAAFLSPLVCTTNARRRPGA